MGKDGAPAPPDYMALANRQGQINQQTAALQNNNAKINQQGPTGSSTWSSTVDQPGYDRALSEYQRNEADWRQSGGKKPGSPNGQVTGQNEDGSWNYAPSTAGDEWNTPTGVRPVKPVESDYLRSTQTTQLSPEQQKLYESQTRGQQTTSGTVEHLAQNANTALSKPRDLASGIDQYKETQAPQYDDASRLRSERAVQSYFDRNVNPILQQQRKSQQNDLVGMGFSPGDEGGGYSTAMKALDTNQANARLDAADRAVLTGGSEGRADYASRLQGANFASNEQKARLAQQLTRTNVAGADRGSTINELQALRSGNQVQVPQFTGQGPSASIAPTDLMSAAQSQYGGQLQSVNANNANQNSLYSGLLSLAGSYFGPWGAAAGAALGRAGQQQYQIPAPIENRT